MAGKYLQTHFTPNVLAAQRHFYGQAQSLPPQPAQDALTAEEIEFIAQRDSFYMATVTGDGWPYLQHRGGPAGFLQVVGPNQLAFADLRGNRQLLTTGNLTDNNRVALFLMDYPQRTRLKLMGHATVLDAREHPDMAAALTAASDRKRVERIFQLDVISFDWNCPQYITPRFTEAEVRTAMEPLHQRIAQLEAELRARA